MKRSITTIITVAGLAISGTAIAHFKLTDPPGPTPPSYSMQSGNGSPQLSAPCGQADPGDPVVATNLTSTLAEGSTVSITFTETIPHPGHYRIAIAQDQASLPADPVVTPGATPCGTAAIEGNPTLPVLADNVLDHTAAFSGPQTMTIPLPAGFTCTNCVMQVVEFMSNHGLNVPGGCFYHHCMNVSVTAAGPQDAGVVGDAPAGSGNDAGNAATGGSGGCCEAQGSASTGLAGFLVVGALILRRRRRE